VSLSVRERGRTKDVAAAFLEITLLTMGKKTMGKSSGGVVEKTTRTLG
jgi:hypothetical protein